MPVPHTVLPAVMPAFPAGGPMRPLQGVTILAVEDSRFASEAIRLICQRTGARLRRAETLADARRHLQVYRPDAVIVDLGLPDGRGEWLLAELATSAVRPVMLVGMSGDPAGRDAAMAAGADRFLEKPLDCLHGFLAALAPLVRDMDGFPAAGPLPPADPLALQDDLTWAARLAMDEPDAVGRRYLGGFLTGLARQTQDSALAHAAALTEGEGGLDRVSALLTRRLDRDAAFRRPRA